LHEQVQPLRDAQLVGVAELVQPGLFSVLILASGRTVGIPIRS
jgi:hypothetical protein